MSRAISKDEWRRLWREARMQSATLAYHEHHKPDLANRKIRHNLGQSFGQALEVLDDRSLCWWQDDYEWADWDRWGRFKNLLARGRHRRDPFLHLRPDYIPEPIYCNGWVPDLPAGEVVCE